MSGGNSDVIADASAAEQFRLAQKHCGNCRSYHAMWGYVQLAGLRNRGVELDGEMLKPVIASHTLTGSRILIAGAADAASLAMTKCATSSSHLTVADRCETPLAVCREYARTHEFSVTTLQLDIAETQPEGVYDLVLAHLVLMFIPGKLRVRFLRNLGSSLDKRGRLLLVHRSRNRKRGHDLESETRLFAERVIAGLLERGIQLPSDESCIRQQLIEYCAARSGRDNDPIRFEDVAEQLIAAGFSILECIEYLRPTPIIADNATKSPSVKTCVFVASLQA